MRVFKQDSDVMRFVFSKDQPIGHMESRLEERELRVLQK